MSHPHIHTAQYVFSSQPVFANALITSHTHMLSGVIRPQRAVGFQVIHSQTRVQHLSVSAVACKVWKVTSCTTRVCVLFSPQDGRHPAVQGNHQAEGGAAETGHSSR